MAIPFEYLLIVLKVAIDDFTSSIIPASRKMDGGWIVFGHERSSSAVEFTASLHGSRVVTHLCHFVRPVAVVCAWLTQMVRQVITPITQGKTNKQSTSGLVYSSHRSFTC